MLESYEELIKSSIGEIGFSQIFVYIGLKFGLVFTGWAMLMMSIAGATPKWWSVGQQWNNTGKYWLEEIEITVILLILSHSYGRTDDVFHEIKVFWLCDAVEIANTKQSVLKLPCNR